MSSWLLALLAFTTLTGGLIPFALQKKANDALLKTLLSFGGSFLFSVTILYLIPETYESGNPLMGVFVLCGFFFQIVLEQFTGGVEHGHLHLHTHKNEKLIKAQVFFSLSMHSFMEGIPLGTGMFADAHTQHTFLLGIMLHELPAAFALSSILHHGKRLNIGAFALALLYAIMAPSGAWLSHLFTADVHTHSSGFEYLMAFIIGTFLHISTIILFENSPNHRFSRYKIISIVLGAVLASLSLWV
jgi:zinc transporter ZupT